MSITIGKTTYHTPYSSLIRPLTETEFGDLKADIESNGITYPVIIDEDNNVIDGQHRLTIAAELGLADIPFQIRPGLSDEDRQELARNLNLHRRHLSAEDRQKAALEMRQNGHSYRDIGEKLGVSDVTVMNDIKSTAKNLAVDLPQVITGKDGKQRPATRPRTSIHARSPKEAKQAQTTMQHLVQLPEGSLVLDDLKKEEKQQERRRKQEQKRQLYQDASVILPDAVKLHHGDFTQVCTAFEPDSIDAIITDPPYGEEFLPLYESLAKTADRLLRPGGSLLVMCGQMYLPEVFRLMTPYLNYYWTHSYLTPGGQSSQIWMRKINNFWKPVLWFVKGEYKGEWHGDVFKSDGNDNDKRFHHWGQSESGMARLIESFTKPGDIVLDPMMGGGTTGVVAIALKRQFIGIDLEPESVKMSKERIYEYCLTL